MCLWEFKSFVTFRWRWRMFKGAIIIWILIAFRWTECLWEFISLITFRWGWRMFKGASKIWVLISFRCTKCFWEFMRVLRWTRRWRIFKNMTFIKSGRYISFRWAMSLSRILTCLDQPFTFTQMRFRFIE